MLHVSIFFFIITVQEPDRSIYQDRGRLVFTIIMSESCNLPTYAGIVDAIKESQYLKAHEILEMEDRQGKWQWDEQGKIVTLRFSVMRTTNFPQIGEGENFVFVQKKKSGATVYQFDLVEIPKLRRWFAFPDPMNDAEVNDIEADFKQTFDNACIEVVVKTRTETEGKNNVITSTGNKYKYSGHV